MTSQKHYIEVAAALRSRLASGSSPWAISDIAHDLARIYRADNDRFDTCRFFAACGLDAQGTPPTAAMTNAQLDEGLERRS